jgi:hypothetical protein
MPKKLPPTSTFVTVLSSQGASSLVQYEIDGVLKRCYVPAHKVENSFVLDTVLASGIPYGFPWEEVQIHFDMQLFSREMHNADLWTAEDVLRSPKKVTGVLRKIFEDNFRAVLETAVREKKRR